MKHYKIGYTSGVFDMFHVGHLNILERAKKQCDYLIVGVSTDELVMEYKHKRPVIPYEDRLRIIASICYVDEAVPQTSMDKFEAWKDLHYNVMFHGDEWKNSPLYQKYVHQFEKVGVDIVFLPHTDGISSTQIQKALCKNVQAVPSKVIQTESLEHGAGKTL